MHLVCPAPLHTPHTPLMCQHPPVLSCSTRGLNTAGGFASSAVRRRDPSPALRPTTTLPPHPPSTPPNDTETTPPPSQPVPPPTYPPTHTHNKHAPVLNCSTCGLNTAGGLASSAARRKVSASIFTLLLLADLSLQARRMPAEHYTMLFVINK